MTDKKLQKELDEARDEIKRLTEELKCARCTRGQCPQPYIPHIPYQPLYPWVEPYRPWWGITTPHIDWSGTPTASDTFTITSSPIVHHPFVEMELD